MRLVDPYSLTLKVCGEPASGGLRQSYSRLSVIILVDLKHSGATDFGWVSGCEKPLIE